MSNTKCFEYNDDVITICKNKVNTLNFSKETCTINIDGTCCTKKTTLLSILKNTFKYNVSKVQYNNKIVNPDSYGPSMVGYICSGLIDQTHYTEKTFNDRSPLNCLEWSMLWRLMSMYYTTFGNQYPIDINTFDTNPNNIEILEDEVYTTNNDDNEFDNEADFSFLNVKINVSDANCLKQKMKEFFTYFDNECDKLKNWYVYAMIRKKLNTIVLIDSNEMRVYELLKQRQNGQDIERAKLNFYVPLQNRMYKNLYPETVIDLHWFDCNEDQNDDVSSIVFNIASFLDGVMSETYDKNKLSAPIIVKNTYPISEKCLDLTKLNEETHTNRVLAKINNLNTIQNADGMLNDEGEQKILFDEVTTDLTKNFLSHINGYVYGSTTDQYNPVFDFVDKKNKLVNNCCDSDINNNCCDRNTNNNCCGRAINNNDIELMDTYDTDTVTDDDDDDAEINEVNSNIIFKKYDLKRFIHETKIEEFS